MNNINFEQTGGFPLETDSLSFLQATFGIFNALGAIAGDAVIVSGCVENGSNVGNGTVYLNGELLEFRGGSKTSTVKVFESVVSKEFENGESKPVFTTRWVGFGSGAGSVNWSSFTRLNPLKEMQKALVPVDTIVMYGGALNAIPAGWHLCNGSNGTKDLRAKFVVGYDPANADYNAEGKTGGQKEVTLTEAQMPSHNHDGSAYIPPHTHSLQGKTAITHDGEGGDGNRLSTKDNIGNGTITQTSSGGGGNVNISTANKGSGQAHENRPPYYTAVFIQYKGN